MMKIVIPKEEMKKSKEEKSIRGFKSKQGKNPIKQLENTPLKIIGRFFLSILAFLIFFFGIGILLYFLKDLLFFRGELKELPGRLFLFFFAILFFGFPLWGICGMLFPKRRLSVRTLRGTFTRKEMLLLLKNEQFNPTSISSLSVSENWAFLMGTFVPKNYVWKVASSVNVGNGGNTQYSISLITGKSTAILTSKIFYNENMPSNMEILKATFPNAAFMSLYKEFDEKKIYYPPKEKEISISKLCKHEWNKLSESEKELPLTEKSAYKLIYENKNYLKEYLENAKYSENN